MDECKPLKTGTSFVRSLRLVLTACALKNFDCSVGREYQHKMRKSQAGWLSRVHISFLFQLKTLSTSA